MKKTFDIWLKEQISARGWTQRIFSEKLDIDESSVSNYIHAKRIPNTRTLIKIMLVLHDNGPQEQMVRILLDALQRIENIQIGEK